mgnify:CR=1 FL=1
MTKKTTPKIHKKFPKSHRLDMRLEIGRILIEELTNWKDGKKPTKKEFCTLVDRLEKNLEK